MKESMENSFHIAKSKFAGFPGTSSSSDDKSAVKNLFPLLEGVETSNSFDKTQNLGYDGGYENASYELGSKLEAPPGLSTNYLTEASSRYVPSFKSFKKEVEKPKNANLGNSSFGSSLDFLIGGTYDDTGSIASSWKSSCISPATIPSCASSVVGDTSHLLGGRISRKVSYDKDLHVLGTINRKGSIGSDVSLLDEDTFPIRKGSIASFSSPVPSLAASEFSPAPTSISSLQTSQLSLSRSQFVTPSKSSAPIRAPAKKLSSSAKSFEPASAFNPMTPSTFLSSPPVPASTSAFNAVTPSSFLQSPPVPEVSRYDSFYTPRGTNKFSGAYNGTGANMNTTPESLYFTPVEKLVPPPAQCRYPNAKPASLAKDEFTLNESSSLLSTFASKPDTAIANDMPFLSTFGKKKSPSFPYATSTALSSSSSSGAKTEMMKSTSTNHTDPQPAPLSYAQKARVAYKKQNMVASPVRSRRGSTGTRTVPSPPSTGNSPVISPESMDDLAPRIADGVSSPLPQNLKGDPRRQKKIKTELCLFFSRGEKCPFGKKCNYAHGEHELKYTTLEEMDKANLISDVKSYRSYPCFDFVATGACPFHARCGSIHDDRIKGTHEAWLPHCDIAVSSLDTDLVVDKSHHQMICARTQVNPLVQDLLFERRPSLRKDISAACDEEEVEWRDTYSLVCNITNVNPYKGSQAKQLKKKKVSELQRICIASLMGYGSHENNQYVYKPEHLVYDTLCMKLRTQYFKLVSVGDISGTWKLGAALPLDQIVKEISRKEYLLQKGAGDVVAVTELAFGLCGEPASRVSLWMDLPKMEVLSPQEVKRFKRNQARETESNTVSCFPENLQEHTSRPFFKVQPVNNDAVSFSLVSSIIHHRISFLANKTHQVFDDIFLDLKAVDSELREEFVNLKNSIDTWKYPVSKHRRVVSPSTSIPKVRANYDIVEDSNAALVWSSFTSKGRNEKRRLSIFESFSEDDHKVGCCKNTKIAGEKVSSEKENTDMGTMGSFFEEWEKVKSFYEKSRE
ncbi:hypothetical protein CTEN210_06395 [Chaetoceros tenuissimus]|uniref:C3H1-type domain-containing protein n=1 Tax=Chaetoceros tenuissimus TaxID=426638 RepID=A0AAD3CSK0_9STRA|nr:hypothetical protein CTEN210_06395 [Chaetoceros tenuissimus]